MEIENSPMEIQINFLQKKSNNFMETRQGAVNELNRILAHLQSKVGVTYTYVDLFIN